MGKRRGMLGMACLVKVLIGVEPRTRDIKEGESLKGRVTIVTKSVIIVRIRGTYK